MRPLQLSPETAVELAKKLNVPLEELMHMPKHILVQKMMQLEASQAEEDTSKETD
ncbi:MULTISPECIES: YycC family protein [unclassified Exiguobacterium]|uniref:YycC family protein n=1 Tax=unclassified Exiguobacterium TaxID=2644629 RepID=UPI00093AD980|nr:MULTISPECIES: YycC family protein [unclassified Exiguobacterium]MDE0564132.1 YycC family protein [Exiguobacterium sp. B2(2022)]